MSFDDLPDDWSVRPLTTPTLVADVLDLVLAEADRRAGALAFLLCDDTGRLLAPAVVTDVPDDVDDEEKRRMIETFVRPLGPAGTLHLAIGRQDGLSIRPSDRAWASAAAEVCAGGPRLLGFHLLTLHGYRELRLPPVAA